MELYNGQMCVSYGELTPGIMSSDTLLRLCTRGRVERVRRGCRETPALYSLRSLPLKYRVEVYRRHPDLQEAAESKPFVDSVEADGRAEAWYAEYELGSGRHLPREAQVLYANSAAILNAFGRLLEESDSHHLRQSKPLLSKAEFWRRAAAALPRITDAWPHALPESARRLQRKWADYRRDGYAALVSGKWMNANAAKVDDGVKEGLLTQLMAHHNNLDNAMIAKLYNTVATKQGWKTISASAVGVWRGKRDLVTSGGRLGLSNFRNTKSMQVKRSRPSAPFLMWTLDGWDVELLYQSTKTDKKGHSVTTYTNRLTLEVVLDPCCDYPIGYAVGTHETPELISQALRDAAKHSQALFGEMLRANQLQCDRYAIKAMTPLYEVMSDKLTPARVKNAKAKVVEPYFGYLNKTYCRLMGNWSGFGVTTDPKRQPNSEALNMLRHNFPDEAGVRAQIDKIIEVERARKIDEFRRLMEHLPQERRLPLSKETYLLWFGATTGYKNALEGGGLRPTLLGQKRDYDCWDISMREHGSERWSVRYDPDDLSEVLAVSEDGSLRYMLAEKHVQPMALADRKEGDATALAKVNAFNKQLEGHVIGRLGEAWQNTEQLIGEGDSEVLRRLLIVDSAGQHKLPKARARLASADIKAVEGRVVEVPLEDGGCSASESDDYGIF